MEPTEENRRAFDRLHGQRIAAGAERSAVPDPVRALLPELPGKHVLHLLCGTGEASAELAALGGLVTGVDVWADALTTARERFPDIAFVHADLAELPLQLRRHRIDLVYAGGGVLRYLRQLDDLLASAAGALRQGGRLLLWDTHPLLECLDPASLRWVEDYFGGTISVGPRLGEQQEFRLWTLSQVVNAALGAGFAVHRLEEFPVPTPVRRHDPRIPGGFALAADKL